MGVLRLLLGIGEITYPPSQIKILARWFPDEERPKVNGICLAASSVGQIVATPLAAWFLVLYDWRMVFYVFGAVGILWGLGFWRWSAIPETERRLNEQVNMTPAAGEAKTKLSWSRLIRIPALWSLVLVYICLTYCFWMFLNWLPTYLVEARGFSFLKMGFYSVLPFVAQGTAQILVGWISPHLVARGFTKNFSRKVILSGGFLGASIFLVLIPVTLSPMLAVVYSSASLAFLGACYTPLWTLPTDLSSRWPGTVFGFVGTVGLLGGTMAPIVTGYIVDTTGSWHYAFYLASAISGVGFLAAWFLVSSDSIDSYLAS
jgi:MFS family permease